MGAIQNSINSALASVGGAAVGIKHAKTAELNSVETAENQALIAQEQGRTATNEAVEAYHAAREPGGLIEKLSEADVNYQLAATAAEKAANRKNASPITIMEKGRQADAAKRAFDRLNDEYNAVLGMQDRARAMQEHAAAMTGRAVDRRARFSRKWGK